MAIYHYKKNPEILECWNSLIIRILILTTDIQRQADFQYNLILLYVIHQAVVSIWGHLMMDPPASQSGFS